MFIWVFFHWIMALSWKVVFDPFSLSIEVIHPPLSTGSPADTIPKIGFCQHFSKLHQRVGFVCIPRHYTKAWVLSAYLDNIPKIGFRWLTLTLCQRLGFVGIPWHYTRDWVLSVYLDNIPKIGFCWLTSTLHQRLGFVGIPRHYIQRLSFVIIPWCYTQDWVLLAYLNTITKDWVLSSYLDAIPKIGFCWHTSTIWVLLAYLDTIPKIGFCQHTSTLHLIGFCQHSWTLYPRLGLVGIISTLYPSLGFVGAALSSWPHNVKHRQQTPSSCLRHPSSEEGAGKQCSECAQSEIQVLSACNPDCQTFSLSSQNGSEYSPACFAYCQELSLISTVLVHSTSLFAKASSAIKWPGS